MEKSKRFGVIAFIGFVGFLLGIVANFVYFEALPILQQLFPKILEMSWIIWGLIGAFLSVAGCLLYALNISKRLKMLGLFAVIGFLMGAAANFLYLEALPVVLRLLPQIFKSTWIIWGITGALLSIVCCLIYAYLPER